MTRINLCHLLVLIIFTLNCCLRCDLFNGYDTTRNWIRPGNQCLLNSLIFLFELFWQMERSEGQYVFMRFLFTTIWWTVLIWCSQMDYDSSFKCCVCACVREWVSEVFLCWSLIFSALFVWFVPFMNFSSLF